MILLSIDNIPGKEITSVVGLVRGNTVRAGHLGKDITAVFKNFVGGEIGDYTKLMAEAREQALDRLLDDAQRHHADAVVGVRFSTSFIASGTAEFLVYGTAVRTEKKQVG